MYRIIKTDIFVQCSLKVLSHYGILCQCLKLRVHPAPSVHIFAAGSMILKCVHLADEPFLQNLECSEKHAPHIGVHITLYRYLCVYDILTLHRGRNTQT